MGSPWAQTWGAALHTHTPVLFINQYITPVHDETHVHMLKHAHNLHPTHRTRGLRTASSHAGCGVRRSAYAREAGGRAVTQHSVPTSLLCLLGGRPLAELALAWLTLGDGHLVRSGMGGWVRGRVGEGAGG